MMPYLVVALALAALGSFSWGLRRHFRTPDGMPPRMLALTLASAGAGLLFVVLALRGGVDPGAGAVCLAASLAALALFWWAVATTSRRPPDVAHSARDPDMLYETGPYAYVRHPFYLSYCVFWFGTAVAVGGVQWAVVVLLVAWYYAAARTEEALFLRSPMAASYARYRSRTGMILPWV